MPVYWKPKYGTRSSRHKAWVRQQRKREAALGREHPQSFWQRVRQMFKRSSAA